MTHPPHTYELRIAIPDPKQKQRLIDWLLLNGVESFVEGALDVDINHEYGEAEPDYYAEWGGHDAPVSVYRYSRESLDDLSAKLSHAFPALSPELHTHETKEWMEGWKESFKPFSTDSFYVYPPWISDAIPAGLIPIVIEPGMAFGTGQHATTRLCLEQLGKIARKAGKKVVGTQRVLDVGTGTGILAIGAHLAGYASAVGTDIDDDAILASVDNAKANKVHVPFSKGSVPQGEPYDLVFANILAVVLLRIMGDLSRATKEGGLLVLSGLLVEEEAELEACARDHGLKAVDRGHLDGWSGLVLRKD